jgi:hypothetical protein
MANTTKTTTTTRTKTTEAPTTTPIIILSPLLNELSVVSIPRNSKHKIKT